jgi:hypothetical protein
MPRARVATTATVTLEKTDAAFTVTNVHLDVTASVPSAKKPVSRKPPEREETRPDLAAAEPGDSR